jgi:cell division inhibitor SulA
MPKFLIERELPGAGRLTAEELVAVAQKSCGVLRDLGPQIQWVQSYVTAEKITCVYLAPDAELIREHARRGGFPCDRVQMVISIIDPATAEGALWGSAPAVAVA